MEISIHSTDYQKYEVIFESDKVLLTYKVDEDEIIDFLDGEYRTEGYKGDLVRVVMGCDYVLLEGEQVVREMSQDEVERFARSVMEASVIKIEEKAAIAA